MSIRVTIIDGTAASGLKASNVISRFIDAFKKNLNFSAIHILFFGLFIATINILAVQYYQRNIFTSGGDSMLTIADAVEEEECLPALNDRSLLKSLREHGVICETEVLAQAKLESGNFRSAVFRRANNMFGMRYPKKRDTKAIGLFLQGKGDIIYGTKEELTPYLSMPNYAVYANWEDCVADYKIWQDYSFKTREKYLAFLNGMYAEDSNYIARIKHISARADRMLVND